MELKLKRQNLVIKERPVKIIEVKDREGETKAIRELSNNLDSIEQKADEVYEKVKRKKG